MRRSAICIGLVILIAGCSANPPIDAGAIDALSKKFGFKLPADAKVLAYNHRHAEDDSHCSETWVVRSSQPLAGPDRQIKQKREESPAKSLKSLVEELLKEQVSLPATGNAHCEYVEWRNGKIICRFRQMQTQTDWVTVLESISLE